ncbi:MAG TPA: ABC transporter ATP-binding protein [Armatimonadota bacterium]|jgi:ABC-2 type transport system ATP-binding protein
MGTAVLETHNLTKIYGNRVIAVNGANLRIQQGWVYGLLGPNGAGKTTLMKLLLGLQSPSAGTVELFGERMTPNAAHLRQRIGFLPTNPKFPPTLTPISYLDLVGQLFGMGVEERRPRLASLIRAVDLLHAASQPIKGFSTGMNTRLGIAAALMNDPELLIWDEPTSGLDPAGRKYTLDLLRELGKTKTIIVSSHILSDIDRVCDHAGIIHAGKVIFQGSVREMKETIGRNGVEMEVDGPEAALSALDRRLAAMREVLRSDRRGLFLDVLFGPEEPLAGSLGNLLLAASEAGVEVTSLSTARGQTEEAFIRLLEKDKADGFSRAYNELASTTTGLERPAEGGPVGAG